MRDRMRTDVDERPRKRSREREEPVDDGDEKPARRGDRGSFKYKRRDAGALKKRATQSAGMYDNLFRGDVPLFTPKADQSYCIRILPPTWEDASHYGFDAYIHSNVGADNQRYVCLEKHGKDGAKCPICEEERELVRAGEKEAAYEARAKRSVLVYIINRDDEAAGPMLWRMMWKVDRDIVALSIDKRTNETLYLDEPNDGYDITFDGAKQGKFVEVTAVKIARRSTPLSDSPKTQAKWLDFIQENPIPDLLNLYDEEHIRKNAEGRRVKDDDEDEGPRSRSERKRPRDMDDEEPRGGKRRPARDDDDLDEPRGRGSLRDDVDLDEPPRRKRPRDAEPDEDEDEPEEKPKRRRLRSDSVDEEPPRRKRRTEPEGEDDDR